MQRKKKKIKVMLKVYDFMVENFNPLNTSWIRNQKATGATTVRRISKSCSDHWTNTKSKKVETLNILWCTFLQSKVDKAGGGQGTSLIRVAQSIISTQVCMGKSGHLKIPK